MDQATFHNLLRKLLCLDHADLPFMTNLEYSLFAHEPYRFFVRADDETANKIWAKIAPEPTEEPT